MITTTMSNGMPVAELKTGYGQTIRMGDDLIDELRYNLEGLGYNNRYGCDPLSDDEKRELLADLLDDVVSYLVRKNSCLFQPIPEG